MPYSPLKIQLHKNPMAVPGMIQSTSVMPRSAWEAKNCSCRTIAQMNPNTNGSKVAPATNHRVVSIVLKK